MENYKAIEPLLIEVTGNGYGNYPIDAQSADLFMYFVSKVKSDGLEYWFPENPVDHWCNLKEAHFSGMWNWLLTEVKAKRDEEAKAKQVEAKAAA